MLRILAATFVLAALPLAGCMAEGDDADDPTGTGETAQSRPLSESACLAAGGRWARGGLSPAPLCFLPTPDAGASCGNANDCSAYCLAETRTCSTETPQFGCFALLDFAGAEMTICAD